MNFQSDHASQLSEARFAYCGFSDTANVGDFALYKANQIIFPDVELVHRDDPRPSINLFGGGTLYPYCLRYRFVPKRRLNVAIGLGVADPEMHGQFGLATRWAMCRWRFDWFGCRGPRSQRILNSYGIRSSVTGDTALVHGVANRPIVEPGLVAVTLVGEQMHRLGDQASVLALVRQTCLRLVAEGRRLVIVPFCSADLLHLRRFRDELGAAGSVLDFWSPPINCDLNLFLDQLARCEFLIGERLHSLVLAAAVSLPFVGLAYKHKCYDFAESIGFDDWLLDPRKCSAETLTAVTWEGLRRNHELRGRLTEQAAAFRTRLWGAAEEIRLTLAKKS